MNRLLGGTRLRLAEIFRQPLTLSLLILLPPVVIEMYGIAVASFPHLPALGADPATAGRMTGALFAVAFLAGLVGLFQIISARSGDERAAIAGFPRRSLLLVRLLTMGVIAVLGAAVAFAVLILRVDVAAPGLAFAALVLAALVYGLLGVVVGTVLPRELEGSIVLVFLADMDNALSSGLFPVQITVSVPVVGDVAATDLVPLFHPHELFAAAVLRGDFATSHLIPTVGWILGLSMVSFVAYERVTGERANEFLRGSSA
ncbi:MAG: hypothetical protein ABEJ55_02080 [Halanaeroarchaeum sp.]